MTKEQIQIQMPTLTVRQIEKTATPAMCKTVTEDKCTNNSDGKNRLILLVFYSIFFCYYCGCCCLLLVLRIITLLV